MNEPSKRICGESATVSPYNSLHTSLKSIPECFFCCSFNFGVRASSL